MTGDIDTSRNAILNIAAYRFVPLTDLEQRRDELRTLCQTLDLKGTILLSPEGINLFLAGADESITTCLDHLQQDQALSGLTVKRSYSRRPSFARMKVKIKREIIPFGVAGIAPHQVAAPQIAPQQLQNWLQDGHDVTLLDVRNEYEIAHGTFAAARSLGLRHFRELPDRVSEWEDPPRHAPLVMFCTGGIRCEKAGPYLQQQGFTQVYQLEGGILRYFEECGGEHYDGNCFVFDERVAVDSQLQPVAAE